jgi:hypothetical protein
MKVYVLISATAQPGKYKEAHKAVAETVKYLSGNSAYIGVYDAIRPMHGPNSQVAWLCEYKSLTDYEEDVERRGKDAEWAKVFEPVGQTVDVDNISAQIFRVLEA